MQVTLYWYAGAPPGQSYTVFTQLLDSEGNFVAGHDGFPANGTAPTHAWKPDTCMPTHTSSNLPPDLASGTYQVVAGMYDFNAQRVFAGRPDGGVFKNSAVPLGQLDFP